MDGGIPDDVLDVMWLEVERNSDSGRRFHTVWGAYRERRDTPQEPLFMSRLSQLWFQAKPKGTPSSLTRAQLEALERCEQGEPYGESQEGH